jgi:hypothetical protein
MPSFAAEANALARILALAFDGHRNLETPAEPDVVRLLTEALEHAWLEGADSMNTAQFNRKGKSLNASR